MISVSAIAQYAYCPTAAYLHHIHRIEQKPTFKSILGKIIHKAVIKLLQSEHELITKTTNLQTTHKNLLKEATETVIPLIWTESYKQAKTIQQKRIEPTDPKLQTSKTVLSKELTNSALTALQGFLKT